MSPRATPVLLRQRLGVARILMQGLAMMLAACAAMAPATQMVAPQRWRWPALTAILASAAVVTALKLVVRRRWALMLGWLACLAVAMFVAAPNVAPTTTIETLRNLISDGLHQLNTDSVLITPRDGMVWTLVLGALVVVGLLVALLEVSPAPAWSGVVIAGAIGPALFYTSARLPWCVVAIVVAYLAVLASYGRGTPRPARGLDATLPAHRVPSGPASTSIAGLAPEAHRAPPRGRQSQRFAGAAAALGVSIVAALIASVLAPRSSLWEAAYGFESLLGPRWSVMVSTSLDVGVSRNDVPDRLVGTEQNFSDTHPDPLRLYTAKDFDGEKWTAEPAPTSEDGLSLNDYRFGGTPSTIVYLKYGAPTYLPIPTGNIWPSVGSDLDPLYNPITGIVAMAHPSTTELTYRVGDSYVLEPTGANAAQLASRVVDRSGDMVYADRQDSLTYTPTTADLPRLPEDVEGIATWMDDGSVNGPLQILVINPKVKKVPLDDGTIATATSAPTEESAPTTMVKIDSLGDVLGDLPPGLDHSTLEFFGDRAKVASYFSAVKNYVRFRSKIVRLPDGEAWQNPFADADDYRGFGVAPKSVPSVREYLGVPADIEPRLKALAEQITQGANNDSERATAIQNYLRSTGGFNYTTQIEPPADGQSPVTAFLDSKRGYCIQFATAMVLMARSIGMPARLGVGYLVTKPWQGEWAITARNAHAWPEILFAESGWVRYEPTPAVQSGEAPQWAPAPSQASPTGPAAEQDPAVLPRLTSSATPVPAVAPTASRPTASGAELAAAGDPEAQSLQRWSGIALALLVLGLGLILMARRRALPASGAAADELVWSRTARYAYGAGLDWPGSATPQRIASQLAPQIEASHPEAALRLRELAARVEDARYGVTGAESLAADSTTAHHATRKDEASIRTALRQEAAAQAAQRSHAKGQEQGTGQPENRQDQPPGNDTLRRDDEEPPVA